MASPQHPLLLTAATVFLLVFQTNGKIEIIPHILATYMKM